MSCVLTEFLLSSSITFLLFILLSFTSLIYHLFNHFHIYLSFILFIIHFPCPFLCLTCLFSPPLPPFPFHPLSSLHVSPPFHSHSQSFHTSCFLIPKLTLSITLLPSHSIPPSFTSLYSHCKLLFFPNFITYSLYTPHLSLTPPYFHTLSILSLSVHYHPLCYPPLCHHTLTGFLSAVCLHGTDVRHDLPPLHPSQLALLCGLHLRVGPVCLAYR